MENSLPLRCPACKAKLNPVSDDGLMPKFCRGCGAQLTVHAAPSWWRRDRYTLRLSAVSQPPPEEVSEPPVASEAPTQPFKAPEAITRHLNTSRLRMGLGKRARRPRKQRRSRRSSNLPATLRNLHKPAIVAVWLVVTALLILLPSDREDSMMVRAVPAPTPTPAAAPAPPPVVEAIPAPPVLPPEVDPKGVYTLKITEHDGSTGTFEISLLSKQHVWVQGSETNVERLGNISVKNGELKFSETLRQAIEASPEVIVVGTADVVGKDRQREDERATARSRTLFDVVTKIRGGDEQSSYQLPLGQWRGPESVSPGDQRRIIIVRVLSRTRGMSLTDGVRKTLEYYQEDQPIFKDILNNYSKSHEMQVR